MKENASNRELDWPGESSPVPLRAAPVARLRRQEKTRAPDVDDLVSGFLEELDSVSAELPLATTPPGGLPADTTHEPGQPEINEVQDSGSLTHPELPRSKPEILCQDVDAEIDRTLGELEARQASKDAGASDIQPVPPEPPLKLTVEPHTPARTTDPADASASPKAKASRRAMFAPAPVTVAEPAKLPEQDPMLFLRNSISQHQRTSRRRTVFFVAVILTVVVLAALYFYFAAGSSASADSPEGSPDNASVPAGTNSEGLNPLAPQGDESSMSGSGNSSLRLCRAKIPGARLSYR